MKEQQQDIAYYCTVFHKCETCTGVGRLNKESFNFIQSFCIKCDGTGWLEEKILVKDFLNLASSKKGYMNEGIDYEKML